MPLLSNGCGRSGRRRGLTYLSINEIHSRINSGNYAIHKKYSLLVNFDGTEITSLNDFAILPISGVRANKVNRKPFIRIRGVKGKKSIHNIVYEAWYDDELTDGYNIHHMDFDRSNHRYTNLQKLDLDTHNAIHHKKDRYISRREDDVIVGKTCLKFGNPDFMEGSCIDCAMEDVAFFQKCLNGGC